MKAVELKQVVKLAASPLPLPGYFSEEVSALDGCACDKNRRFATREAVAAMIRGICQNLDGSWNMSEMEEIKEWSKRIDLVN